MNKYYGYIGTYTQKASEGIYSFVLDTNEKKISEINLVAKIEKPSYLAVSPDNQRLYTIMKVEDEGGVGVFSIDKSTKELNLLDKKLTAGAPPCHISISPHQEHLFASNYHKGTIDSFLMSEDGTISPANTIQHIGNGPDPRQERSHTHYAALTPDEKYVIAIDLGSDKIYTYFLKENGAMLEQSCLSVKPGCGPRHIAFHPSLEFAYVICELSSEIIVLSYNKEQGSFTELQYIPTIPEQFSGNNQGSAIQITSCGRFLYAGNRGHDSIAIFSIDSNDGAITPIDRVSTMGKWPRDFTLDPSEKFLIVANQESDNLVLFSRDMESGTLHLISDKFYVPEPVCVKFMHV